MILDLTKDNLREGLQNPNLYEKILVNDLLTLGDTEQEAVDNLLKLLKIGGSVIITDIHWESLLYDTSMGILKLKDFGDRIKNKVPFSTNVLVDSLKNSQLSILEISIQNYGIRIEVSR